MLFLLIGSPRFPAWRTERFDKLRPWFADLARRQHADAPALGEAAPVAALAETLGLMPACGGNGIELIDDYDAMIGPAGRGH